MEYDEQKDLNNLKILEECDNSQESIEKFADVLNDFIKFYISIGIPLEFISADELLSTDWEVFHTKNQWHYVRNFLKRFIDIWDSKEF